MTEPFPGAVLDLLDAAGDRVVFEHLGRKVTGAALLADVRRITRGLRRHGVRPGDGVALLLGVSPEAFAAVVAAHTVGARVVGVRPGLTERQRAHLLTDVAHRVTDRPDGGADTPAPGSVLRLADLLSAADDGVRPRVTARPGDVARLIHTSGSTGLPKACAQTYAAMTAAWALRPDAWPPAVRELAARLDRFLVFGTLASQVMLEYGLLTLAAGGTLVTADPPAFPDAFVRLRATASVITVAPAEPAGRGPAGGTRGPGFAARPDGLRVPARTSRLGEAAEVLGPVVFHGYGQTETGMISMATPADEPVPGRPAPHVELEVRDPRPARAGHRR
ncbi:AMP-dependent synthetase OS=Streptomyces fumanus OX=67302 GN=GCM10018772_20810 PE=4 SV=1 [Streptomyces fumanus]